MRCCYYQCTSSINRLMTREIEIFTPILHFLSAVKLLTFNYRNKCVIHSVETEHFIYSKKKMYNNYKLNFVTELILFNIYTHLDVKKC